MFKVKRLSLFELNSMVRDVISMSLPDSYWVEAELSEAREGYGGHCYLELIEKDERSNTPIAKAHASCCRNRWMFIKPNFERITGQRIHAGMKVLLKVKTSTTMMTYRQTRAMFLSRMIPKNGTPMMMDLTHEVWILLTKADILLL